MKLAALAALTGLTERQIRFLISEGFVPPPTGGRAHADYGDDHTEAVTRYMRMKAIGFPPAAIRLLLDAKAGMPFPLEDGVTLVVSPDWLGRGGDPTRLTQKAHAVLERVLKGSVDEFSK